MAEILVGEEAQANEVMQDNMKGKLRHSYTILYEGLKPMSGPPPAGPGIFAQIVTRTPLSGKMGDLRKLCLEQAEALQSQGRNVGVRVQLAGPDAAGAVEIIQIHGGLGEWGTRRAETRESASIQKLLERFGAVTADTRIDVFSNVVPVPTAN